METDNSSVSLKGLLTRLSTETTDNTAYSIGISNSSSTNGELVINSFKVPVQFQEQWRHINPASLGYMRISMPEIQAVRYRTDANFIYLDVLLSDDKVCKYHLAITDLFNPGANTVYEVIEQLIEDYREIQSRQERPMRRVGLNPDITKEADHE